MRVLTPQGSLATARERGNRIWCGARNRGPKRAHVDYTRMLSNETFTLRTGWTKGTCSRSARFLPSDGATAKPRHRSMIWHAHRNIRAARPSSTASRSRTSDLDSSDSMDSHEHRPGRPAGATRRTCSGGTPRSSAPASRSVPCSAREPRCSRAADRRGDARDAERARATIRRPHRRAPR